MRLIATLHVISFFDDLQEKADPSVPTILCGDFNAVFDRSVHQFGSDPSDLSRESSSSLQHLFDACCTVDIWRYLHPSSSCFSWTRWDGYHASRIDLCGIPYVWVWARHKAPELDGLLVEFYVKFWDVSVRILFLS